MIQVKKLNFLILITDGIIYHSTQTNCVTFFLLYHYFGVAVMTKFCVIQGCLV